MIARTVAHASNDVSMSISAIVIRHPCEFTRIIAYNPSELAWMTDYNNFAEIDIAFVINTWNAFTETTKKPYYSSMNGGPHAAALYVDVIEISAVML